MYKPGLSAASAPELVGCIPPVGDSSCLNKCSLLILVGGSSGGGGGLWCFDANIYAAHMLLNIRRPKQWHVTAADTSWGPVNGQIAAVCRWTAWCWCWAFSRHHVCSGSALDATGSGYTASPSFNELHGLTSSPSPDWLVSGCRAPPPTIQRRDATPCDMLICCTYF